jgi:ATP-dependent DNA ligase
MGSGAHEGEDGRVRVVEPGACWPVEFLEWTPDNRLRHSKYVGLTEGKAAQNVVRE